MKNIDWDKEFPEVPRTVHHAVLEALDNLPEKEGHNIRRMRKRSVIILVAALVAVLGTTVAAAELVRWNQKAAERFGNPPVEVQEKLLAEGVAQAQEMSVTDRGITVTAVQTVQDEQRVYILLKVAADQPIIDKYSFFTDEELVTEDSDAFDNIACGFTDEGKELALTNQGYYEIDALKTINREWDEKQVKVSLQGFGYYTCDEAGNDTLHSIDGSWELELPLNDASENTRNIELNQTVELAGVPVTVKGIALSPISLEIRFALSDVRALADAVYPGQEDYFFPQLYVTGFIDNEGNEIPCGFKAATAHWDEEANEEIHTTGLSTAIDEKTVTAVLLGEDKVRVELN